MPDNHLSQALQLANKDFNLEIPAGEIVTTEDFQRVLAKVVQQLLNHDFGSLVNGLYRIDVSEENVKLAMASGEDVADKIAGLIIEREMQKVVTRQKYK